MNHDPLIIAGTSYASRLLVGTGKYKDFAETKKAVMASGAQIITVAIRRTNIGQEPGQPSRCRLQVCVPVLRRIGGQA